MRVRDRHAANSLFRRYPSLADRLPWVPIVDIPTPVQRLSALERRLGAESLWVKRDDLTSKVYGGNKPRKLEYLLGAARERGSRTLITFGGLGSNHVLATAVHGCQLGFAVAAILVPQPLNDHIRQTLAAVQAQGTRIVYAPTNTRAGIAAARLWLAALVTDRRRPYLIPPGGSSVVGSLGYVGAAFELAEQVERGELPVPDATFVAGGSNGTAAGLLIGLRLAGLAARLVVVRVSDRLPIDATEIARLANATAVHLGRFAETSERVPNILPSDPEVWDEYLGAGYGHPTKVGDQAAQIVAESEGLVLDRTYTGKTMAALLDAAARPDWREQTLLFWHTYNSRPIEPLLAVDEGSALGPY